MLAQDLLAPLDGSGLPPEVRALEDAEGELRVGLPALTEAVVVEEAGAAGTEAAGWAEVAGYVQRARRRSEQRAQALARRDAAQARHESSHHRLLLLRLFLHYLLPLPSTSPRRSDSSSC